MIGTLLKKQLMEIFRSYFYDTKHNRGRSKLSTIGMFVLYGLILFGMLGGMFTMLSVSLCAPLASAGVGWLYFVILSLIAILLGIFGSVFSTYSGLYLAKDNDLLFSLPVEPGAIMLSRLLGVYLMGLLYSAIVIVPGAAVYLATVPFTLRALCGCIVLVLLISVFVLTLSCLLGWVVAKASLRLKNKSLVTVLLSLLFVALYYFLYFKAMNLVQDLLANAVEYGEAIRERASALWLLGRVGEGDALAVAVCTAAVALLFALMWRLMRRSFLAVATSSAPVAKRRAASGPVRQHSADAALLKKEFGRLGASPNYILNCALGALLVPALGVIMLLRGRVVVDALGSVFAFRSGAVTVLLCAALCMACSMIDTAAPSVSLEGKNIWLPRSLPVDPRQVLRAKLRVQLLLSMPALLFASLCCSLVLRAPLGETLALFVLPQLYALLFALLALTLDLKRGNLEWTNELVPIKQSMTVMIVLFGGWIYAAVLAGLFLLAELPFGGNVYLWLFAALTGLGCLGLSLWLRRRGAQAFMEL